MPKIKINGFVSIKDIPQSVDSTPRGIYGNYTFKAYNTSNLTPNTLFFNQSAYDKDRDLLVHLQEEEINKTGIAATFLWSTNDSDSKLTKENNHRTITRVFDVMVSLDTDKSDTFIFTDYGAVANDGHNIKINWKHFNHRSKFNYNIDTLVKSITRGVSEGWVQGEQVSDTGLEPHTGDIIRLKTGDTLYYFDVTAAVLEKDILYGNSYWSIRIRRSVNRHYKTGNEIINDDVKTDLKFIDGKDAMDITEFLRADDSIKYIEPDDNKTLPDAGAVINSGAKTKLGWWPE